MEGIKVNPQDPDIVEFEIDKGAGYIGCILCLKLLDTRIGLICAPFSYCWGLKLLRSQFCSVEEHRIIHKYGWMDRNERIVSLDRIQDVNIEKGAIQRLFGVSSVVIQTGGQGIKGNSFESMIASQRGSIALHAPKNPEAVRDMIMRKREIAISHVKINDGISAPPLTTPQMTTTTTTKGVTNTQLTSTSVLFQDEKEQQELREIKESLLRIEEFGE